MCEKPVHAALGQDQEDEEVENKKRPDDPHDCLGNEIAGRLEVGDHLPGVGDKEDECRNRQGDIGVVPPVRLRKAARRCACLSHDATLPARGVARVTTIFASDD